jgi:hypothetical protein
MEIRIVRLSSGEEVICKTETDGETTKIKNPAILMPMGGGQLGMMLGVRKETIMSEKNSWESMKSDIGTGLEVAGFMVACYVLGTAVMIGLGLWIFIGG